MRGYMKKIVRQQNYLKELNGNKIILPDKFLPQKDFLEIHYNKFKTTLE